MGLFNRFKRNGEEQKTEIQKEDVMDTNSIETPSEMEKEHEIVDIVEDKDVEITISETNTDHQEEEDKEGETVQIETTEMTEQQEEVKEEEEVEVEVNVADGVKEEVHISIPEEQDVVDVGIIEMKDTSETETELVDPFFDSSKKYYSDVKLNILEKRLDTLLHTKKQLLSNPKPDNKKLEEIVRCIQTIKSEIDDVKYEACRFSSEV